MRAQNPNGSSIGSAVSAKMAAECPYILQMVRLTVSPSKLPNPMEGSVQHVVHGSLGPAESSTQTAIHRFSVFARLTSVTD